MCFAPSFVAVILKPLVDGCRTAPALVSAESLQTSCTETSALQAPPQGNPKALPRVAEIHNPFRKFWLYRGVLSQLNMPGKALWELRGKHLNRLSEPPSPDSSRRRGPAAQLEDCDSSPAGAGIPSNCTQRRSPVSHSRILAAGAMFFRLL